MKLEPDFFDEALRIINGKIVPPSEAAIYADKLESIEELFCWLLLRQGLGQEEKELADHIVAVARNTVTKPESSRQQSNFPKEQRQAQFELEAALKEMLKADQSAGEIGEKARRALVDFNLSRTTFLGKGNPAISTI
ncbi:MAG: hypothetical protein WCE58_12565 [Gallionella sp.]